MVIGSAFSVQATTEQLCQLARLLARRRLRERNYAFRQYLHSDVHADVERFVLFCSSSYCKEEIDRQDSE